jgi:thiosulfate/3-mercaptopyruvate sulfurtransferase
MTLLTTLIDANTLAARLHDPGIVVLDCRYDLARPAWGEQAYLEGHIEGAIDVNLDRDLSGPVTPVTGRHPLPDAAEFARLAGSWGIDSGTQVVACDQGNGMYAARAWWLLRWLGHAGAAVLDGGVAAWVAAGQPLTTALPQPKRRVFTPVPQPRATLEVSEVRGALEAGSIHLVDARAADRYAGQNETIDPVAGHVPGAANHPFARNLDERGRMLAPDELRARWAATLAGRPVTELVAMCGSGVSACHNLLALEHAGLPGARLYAGSWSEWIRDPSRPVASGPA